MDFLDSYIRILLLFIYFVLIKGQDNKGRAEILNLLQAVKISRTPPNYDSLEAAVVKCYLDVNQVDSIREAHMDFTADIGLHLTWKDTKLMENIRQYKYTFDYLDFDALNMEKVWVPDIYFPNEKKAAVHNIMMANKMLRLYKNSTVSYKIRVSVTLSCQMDLRKYPFDKQVCSILMESFSFTSDQLILLWDESEPSPLFTANIKELRQFRMIGTDYKHFNRSHGITGNHSCLQADFHLVRNIGYYVIQMYVPSLLIVMLSWLSFWLNVNSIPGRVTLGVLSVLTISTQSTSVNASLPRVSYTKAIDVWMATCLVFVFAALIEFAVVNVLSQKVPGRRFSLATLFLIQGEKEEKEQTTVDQDGRVSLERQPRSNVVLCSAYLDIASRVMFPAAFGIFNMIYWIYYLNVTEY
ncbi:glycine receptor subunit alpha-2-like isoform X1 [Ruditapes philippinarum]|uniref:glycine receptor subunit alpha-2-like isoform X1 n=1 Tax=Ruditapes philippinarum TaxID=129788 RepID=UPI00295AB90F|nr:glycine receptor subunit alpha-2-like isoform X1 [Ruditapes philippinarum]